MATNYSRIGLADRLAQEIGVQAQLLALHFALDADGADQASEALHALSREIRAAKNHGPKLVRMRHSPPE